MPDTTQTSDPNDVTDIPADTGGERRADPADRLMAWLDSLKDRWPRSVDRPFHALVDVQDVRILIAAYTAARDTGAHYRHRCDELTADVGHVRGLIEQVSAVLAGAPAPPRAAAAAQRLERDHALAVAGIARQQNMALRVLLEQAITHLTEAGHERADELRACLASLGALERAATATLGRGVTAPGHRDADAPVEPEDGRG